MEIVPRFDIVPATKTYLTFRLFIAAWLSIMVILLRFGVLLVLLLRITIGIVDSLSIAVP